MKMLLYIENILWKKIVKTSEHTTGVDRYYIKF
jgi:hypothetical protein